MIMASYEDLQMITDASRKDVAVDFAIPKHAQSPLVEGVSTLGGGGV
ncbi:MAG: hypothetical protein R3Y28_08925 [Candidatus Gastranaerophilales bacterium]